MTDLATDLQNIRATLQAELDADHGQLSFSEHIHIVNRLKNIDTQLDFLKPDHVPSMNVSQMWALYRKYTQDSNGSPDFMHFMGRAVQGFDCLMINWCNMWLGIEIDGYTHSEHSLIEP